MMRNLALFLGKRRFYIYYVTIGTFFLSWLLVVLYLSSVSTEKEPIRRLLAALHLPSGPFEFAKTGSFGDSFGILSALMASLAAFFTLATYRMTLEENNHLRSREENRDVNSFFFKLCEFMQMARANVKYYVGRLDKDESDVSAIRILAETIPRLSIDQKNNLLPSEYDYHLTRCESLIPYLQVCDHIGSHINDSSFSSTDRNRFSYLLEALLSPSEIKILYLYIKYGKSSADFKAWFEGRGLMDHPALVQIKGLERSNGLP